MSWNYRVFREDLNCVLKGKWSLRESLKALEKPVIDADTGMEIDWEKEARRIIKETNEP